MDLSSGRLRMTSSAYAPTGFKPQCPSQDPENEQATSETVFKLKSFIKENLKGKGDPYYSSSGSDSENNSLKRNQHVRNPQPLTKSNVTKHDRIWRRDSSVESTEAESNLGLSPPLKTLHMDFNGDDSSQKYNAFNPSLDETGSEHSFSSQDTMIMMTCEESQQNQMKIEQSLQKFNGTREDMDYVDNQGPVPNSDHRAAEVSLRRRRSLIRQHAKSSAEEPHNFTQYESLYQSSSHIDNSSILASNENTAKTYHYDLSTGEYADYNGDNLGMNAGSYSVREAAENRGGNYGGQYRNEEVYRSAENKKEFDNKQALHYDCRDQSEPTNKEEYGSRQSQKYSLSDIDDVLSSSKIQNNDSANSGESYIPDKTSDNDILEAISEPAAASGHDDPSYLTVQIGESASSQEIPLVINPPEGAAKKDDDTEDDGYESTENASSDTSSSSSSATHSPASNTAQMTSPELVKENVPLSKKETKLVSILSPQDRSANRNRGKRVSFALVDSYDVGGATVSSTSQLQLQKAVDKENSLKTNFGYVNRTKIPSFKEMNKNLRKSFHENVRSSSEEQVETLDEKLKNLTVNPDLENNPEPVREHVKSPEESKNSAASIEYISKIQKENLPIVQSPEKSRSLEPVHKRENSDDIYANELRARSRAAFDQLLGKKNSPQNRPHSVLSTTGRAWGDDRIDTVPSVSDVDHSIALTAPNLTDDLKAQKDFTKDPRSSQETVKYSYYGDQYDGQTRTDRSPVGSMPKSSSNQSLQNYHQFPSKGNNASFNEREHSMVNSMQSQVAMSDTIPGSNPSGIVDFETRPQILSQASPQSDDPHKQRGYANPPQIRFEKSEGSNTVQNQHLGIERRKDNTIYPNCEVVNDSRGENNSTWQMSRLENNSATNYADNGRHYQNPNPTTVSKYGHYQHTEDHTNQHIDRNVDLKGSAPSILRNPTPVVQRSSSLNVTRPASAIELGSGTGLMPSLQNQSSQYGARPHPSGYIDPSKTYSILQRQMDIRRSIHRGKSPVIRHSSFNLPSSDAFLSPETTNRDSGNRANSPNFTMPRQDVRETGSLASSTSDLSQGQRREFHQGHRQEANTSHTLKAFDATSNHMVSSDGYYRDPLGSDQYYERQTPQYAVVEHVLPQGDHMVSDRGSSPHNRSYSPQNTSYSPNSRDNTMLSTSNPNQNPNKLKSSKPTVYGSTADLFKRMQSQLRPPGQAGSTQEFDKSKLERQWSYGTGDYKQYNH